MDSVKNLADSTINSLKGRLADPIIGNYFITFVIYNWEIFVTLFSDKDVDLKIKAIKALLSSRGVFLSSPFVIPLLVSLIYLFVLPKAFRPAHKWLLGKKVLSENDRFEAEMNLSPNQKIIGELRDKLQVEAQRNNDLSSLKSSHEETIRLQKDQIERYEQQRNNPSTSSNEARTPFSEALKELSNQSLNQVFINIAQKIITGNLIVGSDEASRVGSIITTLYSLKLIERLKFSSTSSAETWKLTPLGTEVLVAVQKIP